MQPLFQHRHYKRIAEIITACPDITIRSDIARLFADGLQGTNPNFDRERFLSASRGQPMNSRDKRREQYERA